LVAFASAMTASCRDLKVTLRSCLATYGPERSFFFYQIIKTKCVAPFTNFRRLPSCIYRDSLALSAGALGALPAYRQVGFLLTT
jgi:hypothetical protein